MKPLSIHIFDPPSPSHILPLFSSTIEPKRNNPYGLAMELSSEDEVRIVGFTPNQSAPVPASPLPTWIVEDSQSRPISLTPPRESIPVETASSLSPPFAEYVHHNDSTRSESPPPRSPSSPPAALSSGYIPPHHPPSPPIILPFIRLRGIPPPHRPSRRPSRRARNEALPSSFPHCRTSRRPSTQPSNRKLNHKTDSELNKLCDTLTNLSQQLHVLSQRRIAERAAANVSEDGPKPETCPICFENFHCPGTCTTRCGHVFHRKCLDACLNSSRSCPVCRSSIHRAELVNLMSGFGEEIEQENAIVDLINESGSEESGVLDESLLIALKSVRELIDQSQAVENLASETRKEKDTLKADMAFREKQLETSKANFKRLMEHREGELKKRTARITRTEEAVQEKHGELNKTLCELRDKETALQVRQAQVEADHDENMRKRGLLEKEKESMREKERRMMALQEAHKHRKAKELEAGSREKIAMFEELLRSKGLTIPAEQDTDRGQDPDKDVFKVDLSNEVNIVESSVKRRKVNVPVKSVFRSVFGGDLKKPSAYSRPQAPRRKGVGVRSFAPERRTVQRTAAVAKKGLNCVSKR